MPQIGITVQAPQAICLIILGDPRVLPPIHRKHLCSMMLPMITYSYSSSIVSKACVSCWQVRRVKMRLSRQMNFRLSTQQLSSSPLSYRSYRDLTKDHSSLRSNISFYKNVCIPVMSKCRAKQTNLKVFHQQIQFYPPPRDNPEFMKPFLKRKQRGLFS